MSKNIKEITSECAKFIKKILSSDILFCKLDDEDKNIACLLKKLGYINFDEKTSIIEIIVPVFYEFENHLLDDISNIIMNEIYSIVKSCFDNFLVNANVFTSVKHGVDIKELGNELWHQIFGFTNEMLVKSGFVQKPLYIETEGRYLRSLCIELM
ncbi:hypothetical protein JYG23_02105 [Sedimentibacter sp. zth1]|uniref:hypothetical protein n=1 Tax=Sedimentibacter sp. zth1 TaxID=2816908 RepID=UPI001A91BA92|nr:hypothetical protein [Sedimentibacter sp. zth1]QSX06276.1 hypothetical protein JYG23_02105 [Sedimentibacter sp. zth1]